MYLYDCAFIPLTLSYLMISGLILNEIAYGFEECRSIDVIRYPSTFQ